MRQDPKANLSGVIVAEGALGNKIVKLDIPYKGHDYALINDRTAGRVEYFNRLGAGEAQGSKVVIVSAVPMNNTTMLACEIKHPD